MPEKAYTVGRTKVYDQELTKAKPAGHPQGPCKLGEYIPMGYKTMYPGGWVWKDAIDAIDAFLT